MIEIVDVSTDGFPVVDFKFQNRGQATAFLHKFTVKVLSARIDPTPVLSHFVSLTGDDNRSYESVDGRFTLVTRNDGWGDALDCILRLDANPLAELFQHEARTFQGSIPQGEKTNSITLNPATMNVERFDRLLQAFKRRQENSRFAAGLGADRDNAISLDLPDIQVELRDIHGNRHTSQAKASDDWLPGNIRGILSLSRTRFIWHGHFANFSMQMPSSQYFVSIDPEVKTTTKVYSVSHSVVSGQVERFQIALGAPKSCHIRLKFTFQIDGENLLESDEFDVHIWAPRDSSSHRGYYLYEDGDELLSLAAERSAKPRAVSEERRLKEFLESGFPFLRNREKAY
jgi:hypothetical protein